MRTAVIRVNLNPAGNLEIARLDAAVDELRKGGLEVKSPDVGAVPADAREIELLLPGDDVSALRAWAQDRCAAAIGPVTSPDARPHVGAATFLSRGTDEDALGVIRGFGISADVERHWENDEEIVIATISRADSRRVPESRLHTALEAALNCEVRIVYSPLSRRSRTRWNRCCR
jgi:hypothetical protein